MRTTPFEEIKQAAEQSAKPEAPRAPQQPQPRPMALRRYFEIVELVDGRSASPPHRVEALEEARARAARRALKSGTAFYECLPWEGRAEIEGKTGVLLQHICFDECSGGERVSDPSLLTKIYPEAWGVAQARGR